MFRLAPFGNFIVKGKVQTVLVDTLRGFHGLSVGFLALVILFPVAFDFLYAQLSCACN